MCQLYLRGERLQNESLHNELSKILQIHEPNSPIAVGDFIDVLIRKVIDLGVSTLWDNGMSM